MTDKKKMYDKNKMNEIILAPYYHVTRVESNGLLASKLTVALNYWLSISEEKIKAIKEVTKMITQGMILLDDIQDNTKYRRTIPSAHYVFGVPLTINASLQMFVQGIKKILGLGHPQAAEVFIDAFLSIMNGQGTEIYWRENLKCPSEEEYIQMSAYKSSYILLVLNLMQLFSDNKTDYSKFFSDLGVYYQIRDEYCNLCKVEAMEEESRSSEFKDMSKFHYCEDITEGRLSWPAIHALNSPNAPAILHILKQRTEDVHMKRYCISLFEEAGSLQYTRDTLRKLDHDLRVELRSLGNNPIMENFLDELRNWDTSAD